MRQLVTKYQPPGVINKAGEIFVDEVTGQIKIGDGIAVNGNPSVNKFDGWETLHKVLPFISLVNGFGSGARDSNYSINAGATTVVYVDPSSTTNGAGTFASPLNTLPTTTLTTGTKYLIKAGTELVADFKVVGARLLCAVNNITISVYDPFNGNEIKNQPNPFGRALSGKWVTTTELATKYFKIKGNSNDLTRALHAGGVGSTSGVGIAVGSSVNGILIRGAHITGCGFSAIRLYSGCRIEDCVIQDSFNNYSSTSDAGYGVGYGIRTDGAASFAGTIDVARVFVERTAQDEFFLVTDGGNGAQNFKFTDCAVRQCAIRMRTSSMHADVWQCRSNPGNYSISRCVVERTSDSFLVNEGQGTAPITSLFRWGPSAADTDPTATGGSISDCIFISNSYLIDGCPQTGQTRNRILGYVDRNKNTTANVSCVNENTNTTHTNCAYIMEGKLNNGDLFFAGVSPTKSGITEIDC